jgi:GntR family transcriptional regulator
MMLNRDKPIPLYHQLEVILKDNIESGVWGEHERIPSESELGKQYGVSRITIRSVLNKLVNEGFLYRIQGKGTFIAEQKIITTDVSYVGIREQLEKQGFNTSTKVIDIKLVPLKKKTREKLQLNETETEVMFIERVRFVNDAPFSLHRSYLPKWIGLSIDESKLEAEQLCEILYKDYNLNRSKVVETLESTVGDSYEAELLGINANQPLLLLEDVIYNSNGIPYEYSKVLFRGDKMKMRFEFNK